MKQRRFFQTSEQSSAFAEGLEAANKGDIHSIKWEACDPYDGYGFRVIWNDEDRKPSELPEKHPPLAPAEYVAHKGNLCPVCRGSDRTGHEVKYDHGDKLVTRGVSCNNPDCEASWSECYELSGYDNLER